MFVMFPIDSFAEHVYMYIMFFVVVCILFCAEKRRSRDESRHRLNHGKGKTDEINVFIFTFLLHPVKGK